MSVVPKASTVGPGTRHDGRYAVRAQAAYERERLGHRGLALVLVEPVAGRRQQVLGLPVERGDEQGGATGVGGRVRVRDGGGQQPARDRRLDAGRRHEGDGGDARVDTGTDRPPVVVLAAGDHEPAVERRRHVVGVTLEVRGELEERLVGGEQLPARDEGTGEDDAGDDRCGRRAEAPRVRDPVVAAQAQARGLLPHQLEGRAHRAHHEVRLVARHAVRAGALHVDHQAVGQHLGLELVAQRQREAEGVEPRTEVGGGGGHGDAHGPLDEGGHAQVRPAAAAAASTSASTTVSTTSPNDSSAVAVSLRPWPVTVIATVAPA